MQQTKKKTSSASLKPPSDYVAVAIAYAEEAAGDTRGRMVGKWVRLAARRFLKDLKRAQGKRPPFVWSPAQANKACAFIEMLPHVEGTWDSPTIKLEPAQVFFVCNLFGFRNPDGTRRFTAALFAVARKNAKSALAAAVLLYVFCMEQEMGPQVISAATTGQQARIVWNVARRMVLKLPELQEAFTVEAFANSIARYDVGGSFKPINSKASTQDGLNPSALCFDELHAHKTRELFDVLRSAAGARKSPLFLYTTTEGYENLGPWSETRHFAFQVLEGVVQADHFLALYYALDEADDDFDESKWIKANPLLGVSVSREKLREYAIEAKAQPGTLGEFRIKRLNRPSSAANSWVDLRRWKQCSGPVDLDSLEGARCWAALDLASTTDMTAWRLLWEKEGQWYTWGRYWVPESAVQQRTQRGSVPYRGWVLSGHIQQTPGDITDYAVVQRDILADCARFNPVEVAFDGWNSSDLANRLMAEGLPMLKFSMGAKSMAPGLRALERAYMAGKLNHGGDPVLTWNAANLVTGIPDSNLNVAPDKRRSPDKIDGVICLVMAFARASLTTESNIAEFIDSPVIA